MGGEVLWEQGGSSLHEAETVLRGAVVLCEREFPEGHPCTLNALCTLSRVLGKNAQTTAEAIELNRRLLTLQESALGANHAQTVETMERLALLLNSQNGSQEAEELFRSALARRFLSLSSTSRESGLRFHYRLEKGLESIAHTLQSPCGYAEARSLLSPFLGMPPSSDDISEFEGDQQDELAPDPEPHDNNAHVIDPKALAAKRRAAEKEERKRAAAQKAAEEATQRSLIAQYEASPAQPAVAVKEAEDLEAAAQALAGDERSKKEEMLRRALALRCRALSAQVHGTFGKIMNVLAASLHKHCDFGEAEMLLMPIVGESGVQQAAQAAEKELQQEEELRKRHERENRAEEERLAAKQKAEEERLTAEKKAEEEELRKKHEQEPLKLPIQSLKDEEEEEADAEAALAAAQEALESATVIENPEATQNRNDT